MLQRTQLRSWPLWLMTATLGCVFSAGSAHGQFPTSIQDLGPPKIDEIGTEAKRRLQHADEYLKAEKWSDAIDTLQQVMDEYQGFVPLEQPAAAANQKKRQYLQHVTPRLYCNARLAQLPPEALKLYRDRVDPQAREWFQQGTANRDADLLQRVVDRAFASSVGDDALFALGEIALSQGDFGRARSCWQQILSELAVPGRLVYPDTDLDPAVVHARLILVSILEGALERAEPELAKFGEQYPGAQGRMAGRQGPLAPALRQLLKDARAWPRDEPSNNWPTFAGNLLRNKRLPSAIDVAGRKWSIPLERVRGNERETGTRRPAENRLALLSYHPLMVGNLVLFNTEDKIYAFDLVTGAPAWPTPDGDGAIYRLEDPLGAAFRRSRPQSDGVPRFTMSVHGSRLYARMGAPYTSFDQRSGLTVGKSFIVGLDLAAEGKLLWKPIEPEDESWAFEGSPVCDGKNIYVALRKATGGASPQSYLACYDADTRRQKWQRYIGTADTWAQGSPEITHNLLTLHRDTLYYNTNMGMVAAVSTDGRMKWITVYPRAKSYDPGRPADYKYRDLTPCIYYQGLVLVAPSDCDAIFALDAETGRREWETRLPEDAVHLLGVAGGHLIASGRRIYWIEVNPLERDQGAKVAFYWPDNPNSGLQGYGRGVLAGDHVYWPTEESIYVFHQQLHRTMRVGQPIRMAEFGATGGNLLATDGYLLVAQDKALVCLGQVSAQRREPLEMAVRESPDAAEPYFHLARYDEATGRWADAEQAYQACLERAGPGALLRGKPLAKVAAERLFRLLIAHSEQLMERSEPADAARKLEVAAQHAARPVAAVSASLRSAQLWSRANQAADSVRIWQQLVEDARLSAVLISDRDGQMTSAAELAHQLLAQAIAQHGAEVYQAIEKKAQTEFAAATREQDADALESLTDRFRHASSVRSSLQALATRSQQQGEHFRSITALKRWLSTGPPTEESIAVRSQLAQAYEAAGLLSAARTKWKFIAATFGEQPAKTLSLPGTGSDNVADFVTARLSQPPFDRKSPPPEALWTRQNELPLTGSLIVPQGTPPDGRTYALEFDGSKIHLLDPETGERKWNLEWSRAAPRWAGYSQDTLLVASDHDVRSLTLNTGRQVWQRELMPSEGATLLGPDRLAPALRLESLEPSKLQIPTDSLAGELNGESLDAPRCRLEQLELGEPGLALRLGQQRLMMLDPATGGIRWGYEPPDGKLTSAFCLCGPFTLVQVTGPKDRLAGRAAVLSGDGKHLHNIPTSNTAWPRTPFSYDAEHAVVVSDATSVQFLDLAAGKIVWERRDFLGASPGQEPDVLSNGKDLAVVFNGEFLARVNPANGNFLWRRSVVLDVGTEIVRHPRRMLAMDSAGVYGVWGGIARAYSLDDGSLRWKQDRYLDAKETRWRVCKQGAYLCAQPVESADRSFELFFLDPATGQPVQRMAFGATVVQAKSDLQTAAGWVWTRGRAWVLAQRMNQ